MGEMRHSSTRFTARIGQHRLRFFLTAEEDLDGALVGFTLEGHLAEDPTFSNMLSITARVASLALQQGTPPAEVVDAMLGAAIRPRGRVVGSGRVATCRSVYDWAAKELAIHYLGREELADHPPVEEAHEEGTS